MLLGLEIYILEKRLTNFSAAIILEILGKGRNYMIFSKKKIKTTLPMFDEFLFVSTYNQKNIIISKSEDEKGTEYLERILI